MSVTQKGTNAGYNALQIRGVLQEHDKKNNELLAGGGGSGFDHSHGELIELPLKQGREKGQFGWSSGLGEGYISIAHCG